MDNKFIWTYGIAAMLLYAAVVILVSAVCLFLSEVFRHELSSLVSLRRLPQGRLAKFKTVLPTEVSGSLSVV